jgi:hypothetical protein
MKPEGDPVATRGGVSDRRGFLGMSVILVVFGATSLFRMLGKPSFAAIRPVDVVQLIGTGMCFGGAIVGLVSSFRGHRAK